MYLWSASVNLTWHMSNGYMPANRTNVHSEGVIFQLLLDTYQICCAGPARSCSSKVQGCALSMMFQLLLDTCSQLLHRQHQCFLLDMCLLRPCFEHLWNSCHLHLCHLSAPASGTFRDIWPAAAESTTTTRPVVRSSRSSIWGTKWWTNVYKCLLGPCGSGARLRRASDPRLWCAGRSHVTWLNVSFSHVKHVSCVPNIALLIAKAGDLEWVQNGHVDTNVLLADEPSWSWPCTHGQNFVPCLDISAGQKCK